MMNETRRRMSSLDCHSERGDGQFGAHMIAHGPADHLAGEPIEDHGQVQPAFAGWNIGEILSANSGGLSQGGEAGHACLGARRSGQPMHNARGVQRGGGTHLLQSGLGEADVTASAHAEGAHAL